MRFCKYLDKRVRRIGIYNGKSYTGVSKQKRKIAHIWRRCGTLQNFFLPFIDELEKQLLNKTVEVDRKKCKNFNIYKIVLSKKYLEILFYTCVPKILMIWSADIERA